MSRYGALLLRWYLMMLGTPILVLAMIVVRCAHYPFLLKVSNFLVKIPSLVPFLWHFTTKNAHEAVVAIDALMKGTAWLRPSCLERSIALRFLLAQVGVSSKIRLGVQRKDETFVASSWVEADVDCSVAKAAPKLPEVLCNPARMQESFFAFPETPF